MFRHDALSRLTAWTDPSGGTWWQDHDVDGRPTLATDPSGVHTRTAYDPGGRPSVVDDGLVVTGLVHDALGRLVAERTARRRDGHPAPAAAGLRPVRAAGHRDRARRRGHPLHLQPGGAACARSWRRPAGRSATCTTPAGGSTARVDGAGQRWELRHDPDGLLVELISPTGLVETFDRDGCGRVTRHRVPGQGATGYGYDPAGRVVAVTDRHGRREFTRDPAGRIVAATDALGHTTGYTYDRRGHLVAVTDPLGGVTRYTHDECGRVTAVTDPLGRTTRYVRDEAGRMREQHDPTGARRRVTHDPSGRPSAVTATATATP